MKTNIDQLFDNIHNLPQVPDVVRELITQLDDPNINMAEIAKNVEHEPTISLKILRLVNSAHYGLSRKIGSISEALNFLGMDELKTLIVASGFTNAVPKIEGFNVDAFWETTFLKASYAKALATEVKLDSSIAYTAAIISNIGTVLIHLGNLPTALEIDQHVKAHLSVADGNRYTYEKRRIGFTSPDVAAELSRRWKFSEELVTAIADSAEPTAIESPSKIACVVNIAEYLSVHKTHAEHDVLVENLPFDVAKNISLSKAVLTEKVMQLLDLEAPNLA